MNKGKFELIIVAQDSFSVHNSVWCISESPKTFLTLHLLGLVFPTLIFLYPVYGVLLMFVPVMGRAGSEAIPDVAMGVLVGVSVIVVTSHSVSDGGSHNVAKLIFYTGCKNQNGL